MVIENIQKFFYNAEIAANMTDSNVASSDYKNSFALREGDG